MKGLVTMGSLKFQALGPGTPDNTMAELNAHPDIYVAAAINVTWNQLEPTEGTFDFSSIETAIGVLSTYNAAHPTKPVVGKLRVWSGPNAPAWVITSSGGAVTVQGHGNNQIQVARYWTTAYHGAWIKLQQHLAAAYDVHPMIQQVSVTSCSSQTFEPFIRPLDPMTRANMLNAGYTDEADLACLQGAFGDYAPWTHVALDFPFNPFPHINPGSDAGPVREETDTTIQIMHAARTALGDRLILANEGLDDPMNPELAPIYAQFLALGGPLQFQAYNPTVPWDAAVQNGLAYKPTQIEIWDTTAVPGGTAPLTAADLMKFAAEVMGD